MEQAKLSNPQTGSDSVKLRTIRFTPFVKNDSDGNRVMIFSVEGVHCASCIWKIESTLSQEKSILEARVNLSTKRLVIKWRGESEQIEDYAAVVEKLGFRLSAFQDFQAQGESQKSQKFLLRCIAISGFAMGNIMLLSVVLWTTSQSVMGMATRDLFHWISALIALPAIFYAGQPFFSSALSALKEKRTNMNVPISLALLLASGMSLFEMLNHGEHVYFDSAVMLLFFLLIGRYLDVRARGKARENAEALLSMMKGTATILEDGQTKVVRIQDLREGMIVLVAVGEKIPTDARVVEGQSEIDTSLITGETLPRIARQEDIVFGGTINISSPLKLKILKSSDDSLLSEIIRLMEKAEQGRAKYVRLADKAAGLYTPVVHSLGALTFLGWWLLMDAPWQVSLLRGVTVLIITCPCALGLAVPVVQVLASSWLMKRGVLLKSGDALERLADIDAVIFDKTGTLTFGQPKLVQEKVLPQTLQMAASLAVHSRHPLSQAIRKAYDGELLEMDAVEEISGKGLLAEFKGKALRLGKAKWCGVQDEVVDDHQELYLALEGQAPLRLSFTDSLRPDAKQIVKDFKRDGINTYLLSGDREIVAQNLAGEIEVDDFAAELLPSEKCDYIEKLKKENQNVLMVGDGLNDAPSLAMANVSMSPATGMDITQNTADLVFQGDRLQPVYDSWMMAKLSTKLVKQNFALAILYNVIAIPLAVFGFVTPLVAAIAMSGSSLAVVLNSFRVNLKK